MTTQELTQSASRIAGAMLASVPQPLKLTTEELSNIARLSVQIVRKIEEEARNPHPERSRGV